MEATKSATDNTVAPNLNLDINATTTPDEYRLVIEMTRQPYEGNFRPLNLIQGTLWDHLIYNWVLKMSKSIRESWREMDRSHKNDLHNRFAVKYGTKKEMEEFKTELLSKKITEDIYSKTKEFVGQFIRRVPSKTRRKLNAIDTTEEGTFSKFTSRMAVFGIFMVVSVEEDVEEKSP